MCTSSTFRPPHSDAVLSTYKTTAMQGDLKSSKRNAREVGTRQIEGVSGRERYLEPNNQPGGFTGLTSTLPTPFDMTWRRAIYWSRRLCNSAWSGRSPYPYMDSTSCMSLRMRGHYSQPGNYRDLGDSRTNGMMIRQDAPRCFKTVFPFGGA
jgi:hypothetical protein